MTPGDSRKDCCKPEAGNLGESLSYMGRTDITYRKCRKCGCRHFEAVGEPGHFGVDLRPIETVRR